MLIRVNNTIILIYAVDSGTKLGKHELQAYIPKGKATKPYAR